MARGKHAKLQDNSARTRKEPRRLVAIHGTCRLGERSEEAVLVTDLSPEGCRLRSNAVGVSRSEALLLTIGEFGPIAGKLEWSKSGALGVSFDDPITEATVERLNVAALAERDDFPAEHKMAASVKIASNSVH